MDKVQCLVVQVGLQDKTLPYLVIQSLYQFRGPTYLVMMKTRNVTFTVCPLDWRGISLADSGGKIRIQIADLFGETQLK